MIIKLIIFKELNITIVTTNYKQKTYRSIDTYEQQENSQDSGDGHLPVAPE